MKMNAIKIYVLTDVLLSNVNEVWYWVIPCTQ